MLVDQAEGLGWLELCRSNAERGDCLLGRASQHRALRMIGSQLGKKAAESRQYLIVGGQSSDRTDLTATAGFKIIEIERAAHASGDAEHTQVRIVQQLCVIVQAGQRGGQDAIHP